MLHHILLFWDIKKIIFVVCQKRLAANICESHNINLLTALEMIGL